jgi:hypothetical protein
MPGGNFNEELDVAADGAVAAAGPLDTGVSAVTEMCVWVVQREDGAEDSIANAMGSPHAGPHDAADTADAGDMHDMHGGGMGGGLQVFDLGTLNARWTFPLPHRFKLIDWVEGSATAMAVGVFVDDEGKQKSFFWSEPVRLKLHVHTHG